jgi:hypothetical protein
MSVNESLDSKLDIFCKLGIHMASTVVIRVKKETARELAKIVGKLTAKRGKKATYDDAIRYLLERGKKQDVDLKELIMQSFEGASPEDFKEYSYGDL